MSVIDRLIQVYDKPLDFNETVIKDLEIVRAMKQIDKSEIQKLSHVPDIINSNTVGSYLYSCFQEETVVEVACTPECSNGIKNPNMIPCDVVSYHKSSIGLIKLNTLSTEDGNVFIESNQWLNKDDIKKIRDDGVKVITIYNQDGNTINYKLDNTYNISIPRDITNNVVLNYNNDNSWIWGVLLFIIVIIISVLCFQFKLI